MKRSTKGHKFESARLLANEIRKIKAANMTTEELKINHAWISGFIVCLRTVGVLTLEREIFLFEI